MQKSVEEIWANREEVIMPNSEVALDSCPVKVGYILGR